MDKLCPLLTATYKTNKQCKGEDCAWYAGYDGCALKVMSYAFSGGLNVKCRKDGSWY